MKDKAVAFSNNDVITIAWCYSKKPAGCMGFTIYRIDEKGNEVPLPSQAVFDGMKKVTNQTTKEFPVQKFYWKDVYARLEAEDHGLRKFRYRIVPLQGKPGKLVPMDKIKPLETDFVEIRPAVSKNVSAFFNRGLISTQSVSRYFKGDPTKKKLLDTIEYKEHNRLRDKLSGDMVEALTGFVDKAKDSGKIYAALYELGDDELVDKLCGLGARLNIILSDSKVKEEDKTKAKVKGKDGKMHYPSKTVDGNAASRSLLKESGAKTWDRVMRTGHIGHNKFLVYVNKDNKAESVLFGSTNWTKTGLCTQTNNTLIIDDTALANRYLDYWKELKKDTEQANGVAKNLQGSVLRAWDALGASISSGKTLEARSWFSPNTPKARSKKTTGEKCPPDMNEVIACINKAKYGILFLAFYPGTPSIANWTAQALKRKKDLFVRGCVTNKSASQGFYYELKGLTPPKKVKGVKNVVKQDYRVFGAEAFDGGHVPMSWQKEILSAGFAIIHDKVVVIDPFSKDCVVISGSHNLGYKASFDNDENLAIIKGNRELAMAYMTHILDVYDHFSFRYWFKKYGKTSDYHLEVDPEDWLEKYYDKKGEIKNAQLLFWLHGAD
jgi:phosphatidylserine/phosphatidylglycerophosphate/cardiolipin synthase-like enzyme